MAKIVTSKIDQLRGSYGQLTQEENDLLSKWEKSLKKHELFKNWARNPVTKEVFDRIGTDVASLMRRLSTEEEMDEVTRRAIFMVKPVLMYVLTIAFEHEKAIDTLEADITEKVQELDKYQSNLPPKYI